MKEMDFNGVDAQGKLSAKMIGGSDISVCKISREGMLFETMDHLKMNRQYKFNVKFGAKKTTLNAKVLTVLWKSKLEDEGKKGTLYQCAAEFAGLKDDEKAFLDALVERMVENSILHLSDRTGGIKFSVTE
ncbi:MAG: hypothetical protein AABZ36_03380 [Nitrospirota bacterium]